MKINISYKTKLPAALRKTKLFEAAISAAVGRAEFWEINLFFVSGPEMRKINKQFLGHDYVTDVISFGFPPAGADIFVCPETAQKNAPLYKQSVLEELLTYAAHGALHLAGMDDKTPKLRAAMDRKTAKILRPFLASKAAPRPKKPRKQ